MRHKACAGCGKDAALREMVSVHGVELCGDCAAERVKATPAAQIKPGDVRRLTDPTLCAKCGADHGSAEWPLLAGIPLCDACTHAAHTVGLPSWLKAAAVVLAALVILAWWRNFRFFAGFVHVQQAGAALSARDLARAEKLAATAAGEVPENAEIQAVAAWTRGVALLRAERPAEALEVLRPAQRTAPAAQMFDEVIAAAEIAVAFDRRDYVEFLKRAEDAASKRPDDPTAAAQVASAHACLYAAGGDPKERDLTVAGLARAAKLPGADGPDFAEYRERIEHRLATRRILSRSQYLSEVKGAGARKEAVR